MFNLFHLPHSFCHLQFFILSDSETPPYLYLLTLNDNTNMLALSTRHFCCRSCCCCCCSPRIVVWQCIFIALSERYCDASFQFCARFITINPVRVSQRGVSACWDCSCTGTGGKGNSNALSVAVSYPPSPLPSLTFSNLQLHFVTCHAESALSDDKEGNSVYLFAESFAKVFEVRLSGGRVAVNPTDFNSMKFK